MEAFDMESKILSEVVDGVRWYYVIDRIANKEIAVIWYGDEQYAGDLAVPVSLGGVPVRAIGYGAFAGCVGLKSLRLPNIFDLIILDTFYGCEELVLCGNYSSLKRFQDLISRCKGYDLLIDDDRVDVYCFFPVGREFDLVRSIYLSAGVEYFDPYVFTFLNCAEEFRVSPENKRYFAVDGVLYVRYFAFHYDDLGRQDEVVELVRCPRNKKHVKVVPGTKVIGECAFFNCHQLTSIEIPESVTTIGRGAFVECCNLISLRIPSGVERIDEDSFASCEKLEDVTMCSQVEDISRTAFYGCSRIKDSRGLETESCEYLWKFVEDEPMWLQEYDPTKPLDWEKIFLGHSVYWTESACPDSAAVINCFSHAKAAHLFICVCHGDQCKRTPYIPGYDSFNGREGALADIAPITSMEYQPCIRESARKTVRFDIFTQSLEIGEKYGARHFALLRIDGDAIELYGRLFCSQPNRCAPLLVGVGDHGGKTPFGIDYKKHHVLKGGQEGWDAQWKPALESILRSSGKWPEFMFAMGRDTKPWIGYKAVEDIDAIDVRFGENGRLYQRTLL